MHHRVPTVHANAQLLLYSRMLPGDFLHYGYFDDPETPADEVSLAGLQRAQLRYAEKLVELVGRPGGPVLDAGSGMGGMLGLLSAAGHDVTGLTPDRFQIEHIRRTYPGVPVLHCRFEDISAKRGNRDGGRRPLPAPAAGPSDGSPHGRSGHRRFEGRFGTVIHSESIQYMRPEGVFAAMRGILAPDGRWIVADYFRRDGPGDEPAAARPRNRSGWCLGAFRRRLADNGFEIVRESDITAHVLPTLGFARLLADRIGLPALDFAADKLRAKRPKLHYVVEDVVESVRDAARRGADVLDPAAFAAHKRYLLMSIRRAGPPNALPPPTTRRQEGHRGARPSVRRGPPPTTRR